MSWYVTAGSCIVVGVACFAGGWFARGEAVAAERAKAADAARARRLADSTCVLATRDSAPTVPVFDEYLRAKEFASAARRGEAQSTLDLILKNSEGVAVARGTPCSLIGTGTRGPSGVSEIRITAGPETGKTGYVPEEWRRPE